MEPVTTTWVYQVTGEELAKKFGLPGKVVKLEIDGDRKSFFVHCRRGKAVDTNSARALIPERPEFRPCPVCGCALVGVTQNPFEDGRNYGICTCSCKHGDRDAYYDLDSEEIKLP